MTRASSTAPQPQDATGSATRAVALRRLPGVDVLLRQPDVAGLVGALPRDLVVELVRSALAEARGAVQAGSDAPETGTVVSGVLARAAAVRRPSLRRVLNATGVVLHTNLGRAPLSAAAREAVRSAALGYSNLEYDVETGERGSRHAHLEALVCAVTGAEAALAVNNNAAAVLLTLAALAAGHEVVVSRGQAVEIGGGFRIPDVLRQSGARLVEVGTTNRTRLADYEEAVTPDTCALLHVHTSNFRVVGFTESVPVASLAALGRARGIHVVDDSGSGCLLDTSRFGIGGDLREPTVQESIAAGADAVCFSGDKLLGGPQAGIIAGKRDVIARLKRHPLTRAVRLDKLVIAALAATLLHYRLNEAEREVPVWQMIGDTPERLAERAGHWASTLGGHGVHTAVVRDQSAIGGGSLPGVTLRTHVLALSPRHGTAARAAGRLRAGDPAVVCRIVEDRLVFDPRTVLPDEEDRLLTALQDL